MTTKELINHTKRLIAIPSTADNPAALDEAVAYVAKLVAECPGVHIEWFEQNGKRSFLAYRGAVRPEKFTVLLNGHVDVVPAKPEQFTPVEKDGKLYGRGALDMKGTTLALADSFCQMVNEVPYALGLQIVCDEEVGGYDGVRLQIDSGVRADFVVMGEYSNERNVIYNAARGLCWAEIAFRGKSSHGAHLWHGDNAVVKAGQFAAAVLKRYPTPDRETWTTTASVANLSTPNDTFNKVPDRAILKIDFRFTQEDPVFQNRESLEAFIASIDPDASIVNLAVFEPAVNVEELNPYVQGLGQALKHVTGKKPRFLGRPGGSDGRHYALVNNDIVEFGLYGGGSHGDNEYVELASFEEYQKTLHAFLQKPVPDKLQQRAGGGEPLHHKLLRKLVGMPTATGDFDDNNRALLYIERFLASRGMHVEQYEYEGYRSIVATTTPDNKQPTVLLNAHIDTVPIQAQDGLELKVKDGVFYGRGVLDMKSAVASYLAAVDRLKDDLGAYDFGIMITSDEEVGGGNGVKPLVNEIGYRPKVVVVPDGGENWQIERFAKGVQWIQLEATGKSGHASRPWEGDSAIKHLLDALHQIHQLAPANPLPTDTILTVGTITGGTTANQIPHQAAAMLDIRYGSIEDYQQLYPKLQAICKAHGITPTLIADAPPCANDPDNAYIAQFRGLIKKITGHDAGSSYSYGATDGRYFNAQGVPFITVMPPGEGRHKDGERLSVEGFNQFCTVIEEYVRQVARRKDSTKTSDIKRLAKQLNQSGEPAYVWYANYGSGLSRANFLRTIRGGTLEGSSRTYLGCTDKTPPLADVFLSLPHQLYFGGHCQEWGGGHVCIEVAPNPNARTIARAYLITASQFEEIAAQQNDRSTPVRLPLKAAIRHGHAAIRSGTGTYDELIYCGTKDGYPMFTLAPSEPLLPYTAPDAVYTELLCKGLANAKNLSATSAVDYFLSTPGVAGAYQKQDVAKFFKK